MDILLSHVHWIGVVVGALVAFMLGSVWFAPPMFGVKWRKGLGTQSVHRPLPHLLIAQAIGSFLFAWVLGITINYSIVLSIFIAVMTAVTIKANGLFSGKSTYAIAVESSFVLAQAAIMIIALSFL